MFGRIDHVGVAVEDIDAALALYETQLRDALSHRETVEEQGVEAVLLDVGENHVELLAPLGRRHRRRASSSPSAGPGCTTSPTSVDDIDAALARCAAAGVRLIDEQPRARHPRLAGRVLHPRRPAAC